MNALFSKHIGYRLRDKINGYNILDQYNILRLSQYWDKTQIEDLQLAKLKKLLIYANLKVPYYRKLFKRIGFDPIAMRSLSELDEIPILSKDTLREAGSDILSEDLKLHKYVKSKTGGTTGPPVELYRDLETYSVDWAIIYRSNSWMGISSGDSVLVLWGARTVLSESYFYNLKKSIGNSFLNTIYINSFSLNDEKLFKLVALINHKKPLLLRGYLSSLVQLADFINENHLRLNYKPVAVCPTSETLYPNLRQLLSEVFNCEVFDHYACSEVNGIANECSSHKGLHINLEHVIVEIENGLLSGDLVVTDLDNFLMPFIRYKNEDSIELGGNKCDCGVTLPLIKSINGRQSDTIELKNNCKVHGVFFTDLFYEIGLMSKDIPRFQVYQKIPGSIELRLERSEKLNPEMKTRLENALNKFFNKYEIKYLHHIENEENGKFRYLIHEGR
jgi:phenylacetate-CoA ligase